MKIRENVGPLLNKVCALVNVKDKILEVAA